MAPRATWKGYMKLSLVSCPVRLYNATSAGHRIAFNWLHKDTQNRIQMKPFDPELGQVERADLVKGYEFEKDQYIVVNDEDLEAIQIESTKTIDFDRFVDVDEIDPIYYDSPYYVAPDGPVAEETFRVIHTAMRDKGKAAIARVVLSGRERIVALDARGKGFVMTTLRSAEEVRGHELFFDDIADDDIDEEMLSLAEMIIDKHTGKFDPGVFEDRYQKALAEVVKAKIKGSQPVIAKAPERGKVINLMDALKRTLEQGERKKPPAQSKSRKATVTKVAPAKAGKKTSTAKAATSKGAGNNRRKARKTA